MKKCPYCAEQIQEEAIVCRYCGRDLRTMADKVPASILRIKPVARKLALGVAILGVAAYLVVSVTGGVVRWAGFLSGVWSSFAPETSVSYSDSDLGLSFSYPSSLRPNITTQNVRGEQITNILLTGSVPYAIHVQNSADPRMAADPTWYPPDEMILRFMIIMDLGSLNLDKGQSNSAAAGAAAEAASQEKISGFSSATYSVTLQDTRGSLVYVRGAVIYTPTRYVRLLCFGTVAPSPADAEQVNLLATRDQVDRMWEKFVGSVRIDD